MMLLLFARFVSPFITAPCSNLERLEIPFMPPPPLPAAEPIRRRRIIGEGEEEKGGRG